MRSVAMLPVCLSQNLSPPMEKREATSVPRYFNQRGTRAERTVRLCSTCQHFLAEESAPAKQVHCPKCTKDVPPSCIVPLTLLLSKNLVYFSSAMLRVFWIRSGRGRHQQDARNLDDHASVVVGATPSGSSSIGARPSTNRGPGEPTHRTRSLSLGHWIQSGPGRSRNWAWRGNH